MTTLSLLVLRARDLKTTLAFYSALGLLFKQEQHASGPIHFAAEVSGTIIEIYPLPSSQVEPDSTTMLGFQVTSLEGTLSELGIEAEIKPSSWGKFCNLKDPDGRTVRLSEN